MRHESNSFSARMLRKQPELPRYIVVDPDHVAGRHSAFAARVSLNGCPEFERNIRLWGKGSHVLFFNLTEPQCRKAGVVRVTFARCPSGRSIEAGWRSAPCQ
jgi:hypothetical protein